MSTPCRTPPVVIAAPDLLKLEAGVLSGLLGLPLEIFTKRRIEAILSNPDNADRKGALATIDAEERTKRRKESVETEFSKLLRPKTRHPFLSPTFVSEYRKEFIVTARSIGAYELAEGKIPTAEQDRNYQFWMGNKLNLSREEIEKFWLDSIERRFSEKLDLARKHVTDRLSVVSPEIRELLKSREYFESLHAIGETRLSPRQLFSVFIEFEHFREECHRTGAHPNAPVELRKAQYEIQRLFGLADLYQDYEQTPEYQNLLIDAEFLERKVSSFFDHSASTSNRVPLPSIRQIRPNNLLYEHTESRTVYWGFENGDYVFSDVPKPGFTAMEVESAEFVGKLRNAFKYRSKVPIVHAEIRSMKDAPSAVDKYLRKGLSSFGEIIDQKGMIIVVDSFDKVRIRTLKALLENEL